MKMYTARAIPSAIGHDIALHRFPVPAYGEKGWYRIGRSLTAFRSGRQKGFIPAHLKGKGYDSCGWDHRAGVLYSLKSEDEQFREREIMLSSMEETLGADHPRLIKFKAEIAAVPVIEHASLYDFYDYIGFDRHKRRYITKGDNA